MPRCTRIRLLNTHVISEDVAEAALFLARARSEKTTGTMLLDRIGKLSA
jgi:hypothetical protein